MKTKQIGNLTIMTPETRTEFLVARDHIQFLVGQEGMDVLDGHQQRPRPKKVPTIFFLNFIELEYPHILNMLQEGSHGYVLEEVPPTYSTQFVLNETDDLQAEGLVALSARAFL